MESERSPAKFDVDPGANDSDLGELFQRIAAYCRRTVARSVVVRVPNDPDLTIDRLHDAVASLADHGCPEGFKLAWIAPHREMFDTLVQTEFPRARSGITARVFFDEPSAEMWLSR